MSGAHAENGRQRHVVSAGVRRVPRPCGNRSDDRRVFPGTDFASPLLTAMIPAMRSTLIEYDVVRNASLRMDGRMVHDVYVFRVKKPAATGVERRDQPSVTR